MNTNTTHFCSLCGAAAIDYHRDKTRNYYQCTHCDLVFVLPEDFLSTEDEKSRYDLHQNSPHDTGYRQFLARMRDPMVQRLTPGSLGLDIGSGPGPTLSTMFKEEGYPMALYDPFYAPDASVLNKQYEFVTATEVVEHLRTPKESLYTMWNCVKPGGIFGIMTKLVIDKDAFANWHYKNDDTHICFFSKATFQWLSQQWKTTPIFLGKDIVLFENRA